MRVLITGATGFVGGHLAETMVHEGCQVRAIVRRSSDTSLLKTLDIEIVYGDITDGAAVENAVRGCERVYHLAAKTSRVRSSRKGYYAVNIEGTEKVACAALKADVDRFVYCSSAGIYGAIHHPPVDEQTKPNPNSHYRQSKLLGEEVVLDYHKREGLPVVVARVTGVFGPRSLAWLGLFQAVATRRFRIIGTGDNHRHIGFIADVVDGLKRCGEVAGIEGECYVITGKEPIRVKHLVEMIAQELGISAPRGRLPAGPFRAFTYLALKVYKSFGVELPYSCRYDLFLRDEKFNISKAQRALGYCPRVSMGEGIRQTIAWYRDMGYLV